MNYGVSGIQELQPYCELRGDVIQGLQPYCQLRGDDIQELQPYCELRGEWYTGAATLL